MGRISSILKQYKPTHWLFNLLNYRKLLHNRKAYRQFDVHKSLFTSISSKDFPDKESRAWLDTGDSNQLAPLHPAFAAFSTALQLQIADWSKNGYLFLRNFLGNDDVDAVNATIDEIVNKKLIAFTHDGKLPFANKKSSLIKNITHRPELVRLLEFLLGKEVVPFQTLNFIKGSNQRAHSDSIHMTTYPLGYLIAVWIALEDTNEDNGPLFYYPGSHKLPYLLNNDFNQTSSLLKLGKKDYPDYEDVIEEVLGRNQFKKETFLAKKGDAFIWHANLIHGGTPIKNELLTRKSMVIHYYAKDVIKYHELTERPSLLED